MAENLLPTTEEESKPEEWRPVVGYEQLYEVSDLGRLRRLTTTNGGKAGTFLVGSPYGPMRYIQVTLGQNKTYKQAKLHTLVCRAFHGDPGPLPTGALRWEVRHLDGNTSNNKASNLAWGTHKQNAEDMVMHSMSCPGEKNGAAVLLSEQVLKIRALYDEGVETHKTLARQFGIAKTTVGNIVHRRTWRHI